MFFIAATSAAWGQSYPARPIRLIIPVQAGSSTNDTIPRAVGQRLAAALGQPVLMDNRVGASGQIGTELAVRSPADGYTLLVGFVVPAKTPKPIVERLYREIANILESEEIKSFVLKQGAEPALTDPRTFDAYTAAERSKWAKVVKAANLKIE